MAKKENLKKDLTTKEHILECAIKLFAKEGYDGLRMDNLAKEAGINKATIYYYFENKQTLYETIIKNLANSFYELLQKNLQNKTDYIERLETFLDSALFMVETKREIAKIMMIELSFGWKNISPDTKNDFIPIIHMLFDILKKGEINNIFNKINPLLLQGIIMGGFNYYLLMKDVFINFDSPKKMELEFTNGKDEIKQMILKSIVKG